MLKKLLIVGATIALLGGIAGCEDAQKTIKHLKSSTVGLNRTVTLYAADGRVIKSWNGKFMVELVEGSSVAAFITDDGREIKISGTYIVEENE